MSSTKINNTLENWLKLYLAPKIGLKSQLEIYQNFPNLDDFFLNYQNLKLKEESIAWFKNPNQSLIESHLNWAEIADNQIIAIDSESYPQSLKQINNPPVLLFVKGNLKALNRPQISIVGSRNPSQNGILLTQNFAKSLAQLGWVITSGLAVGIDSSAHLGCVLAKKPTIAVMGTGINLIYPSSNKKLANDILENEGCLISEFALNMPANSYHFPQRNRIISAMSLACLVMEAKKKSGSLITAKLSNDYGREVYVLPNTILDEKFRGSNELISEGANVVLSLEHFLNEIELSFAHLKFDKNITQSEQIKDDGILETNHPLLKIIDYDPKSIDEIAYKSKMPIHKIQSELSFLELSNQILILPDGQIVRKHIF